MKFEIRFIFLQSNNESYAFTFNKNVIFCGIHFIVGNTVDLAKSFPEAPLKNTDFIMIVQ